MLASRGAQVSDTNLAALSSRPSMCVWRKAAASSNGL